jgi:hypothetical protein
MRILHSNKKTEVGNYKSPRFKRGFLLYGAFMYSRIPYRYSVEICSVVSLLFLHKLMHGRRRLLWHFFRGGF